MKGKILKILGILMIVVMTFSACGSDEETSLDGNSETPNQNSDSEDQGNSDDSDDQNSDQEQLELQSVEVAGIEVMIPEGFEISEFATDLSGARDLEGPDQSGNFWLSRTEKGIITLLKINSNGEVENTIDVFRDLNNPHGLALDPEDPGILYFAEEDQVSRVRLYSDGAVEKLVDLPEGDRHFTRSLHFGTDGRLYISIGSSCDTCEEADERLATIYVMEKNGENFQKYADGLRNAVFMTTDPVSGELWSTEMGRDFLGKDLPPDEVNIVQEGGHYGWPFCYGNQVRDQEFQFDGNSDGSGENLPLSENFNSCAESVAPKVEIPAHSAPLGLTFLPEEGWSENLGLDLVVAYHGSWNRDPATGYKIVRVNLDSERNVLGVEDFISGWLGENEEVFGRPVDVLARPGGILYITDDERGVIYKVSN